MNFRVNIPDLVLGMFTHHAGHTPFLHGLVPPKIAPQGPPVECSNGSHIHIEEALDGALEDFHRLLVPIFHVPELGDVGIFSESWEAVHVDPGGTVACPALEHAQEPLPIAKRDPRHVERITAGEKTHVDARLMALALHGGTG